MKKQKTLSLCPQTGLIYVNEVPLTLEDAQAIIEASAALGRVAPAQFIRGIEIEDIATDAKVKLYPIDVKRLQEWIAAQPADTKWALNSHFNR